MSTSLNTTITTFDALKKRFGVRYQTTPEQLRYLLVKIRELLLSHPQIEPDSARAWFVGFGASSLDIEVFAYVKTTVRAEFLGVQEDIWLRVMDLVEQSGTGFAFPSQTLYLGRDDDWTPGELKERKPRCANGGTRAVCRSRTFRRNKFGKCAGQCPIRRPAPRRRQPPVQVRKPTHRSRRPNRDAWAMSAEKANDNRKRGVREEQHPRPRGSWSHAMFHLNRAVMFTALVALTPKLCPQELEPRAYSNIPIGMNFALAGYAYTEGNVLVDASIPLGDAEISAHSLVIACSRSLNLWGDSGKIDAIIPYSWASGSATFAGQPHGREVNGFGDPALRLTWNFIGAPALTLQEFQDHESNWIVGGSFRVGMPLGQYEKDKLLNIGLNRWSFKPELGVSKPWAPWTFELAGGATFYTDNDEFLGSFTREQDPLIAVQGHVIYSFGKGIWAGFDGTFYTGGRTTLNGTVNDDRQSSSRVGITVSLPVTPHQSLKLYGSTGATVRSGGDFTTAGVVWQYRWGGKMSPNSLATK